MADIPMIIPDPFKVGAGAQAFVPQSKLSYVRASLVPTTPLPARLKVKDPGNGSMASCLDRELISMFQIVRCWLELL